MRDFESNSSRIIRRKRILVLVIVGIAIIAGAILLNRIIDLRERALTIEEERNQGVYEEDMNLVRYGGKWYRQNPDLDTILLIGVDNVLDSSIDDADGVANGSDDATDDADADAGESDDATDDAGADAEKVTKQSDFLLLVTIDEKNKSYEALQINRDTMANVPQLDLTGEEYGTENQQIALAYTYGETEVESCRNTVNAVSNLLYGIDINHYICISMDTVPLINDLVGGVPVLVEDDFSGVDPSIVQGETITLKGNQALTFVRARGSMQDPTNIARMERQRTYMHSLHEQAISKANSDSDFVMRSLMELSPHITSDCTVNEMAKMFDVALNHETNEIKTIEGEAVIINDYMEYHADENALQKQIIDLFFVEK